MRHERMRLLPWLRKQIDSGRYQGLRWLNQQKTLFRIDWKHGSRQGYSPDHDACVFKAWAAYTGKLHRKGAAKTWKANFRCALNSLKEIKHKKRQSEMRGPRAYRVYEIESQGDDSKTRKEEIDDDDCVSTSSDEEASSSDLSELTDFDSSSYDCDITKDYFETTTKCLKKKELSSHHSRYEAVGCYGFNSSNTSASVVPTPLVLQNNDLSKDELLKLVNDIIKQKPTIQSADIHSSTAVNDYPMSNPTPTTNASRVSDWIIKDDPYLVTNSNNSAAPYNQTLNDAFMYQFETISGC